MDLPVTLLRRERAGAGLETGLDDVDSAASKVVLVKPGTDIRSGAF